MRVHDDILLRAIDAHPNTHERMPMAGGAAWPFYNVYICMYMYVYMYMYMYLTCIYGYACV